MRLMAIPKKTLLSGLTRKFRTVHLARTANEQQAELACCKDRWLGKITIERDLDDRGFCQRIFEDVFLSSKVLWFLTGVLILSYAFGIWYLCRH